MSTFFLQHVEESGHQGRMEKHPEMDALFGSLDRLGSPYNDPKGHQTRG